jgi:hypothetical protein
LDLVLPDHLRGGVAPDYFDLDLLRFATIEFPSLVYRLANKGDVAGGQLAVFQGASEAPISASYGTGSS